MVVFNHVASLSTEDVPPVLFYAIGTILWSFFSSLLVSQARVFYSNKDIFGKVYFPRLTVPISLVISELTKFVIQFVVFSVIFVIYLFNGFEFFLSWRLLLIPVLLIWLILLASGMGLVISSITTRYRDLAKALEFLLAMFMYATPVVYPLSMITGKLRILFELNPITAILECFRYACFGVGDISLSLILYSVGITLIFVGFGIVLFNKNEKVFVDVI